MTSAFNLSQLANKVNSSGQLNASTGLTGTAPSATTATNLSGGSANTIPYQTGSGSTTFSSAGGAGKVLTGGTTGSPTWTNAGTSGQVLTSQGTGTPTWTTLNLGVDIIVVHYPGGGENAGPGSNSVNLTVDFNNGTALTPWVDGLSRVYGINVNTAGVYQITAIDTQSSTAGSVVRSGLSSPTVIFTPVQYAQTFYFNFSANTVLSLPWNPRSTSQYTIVQRIY